MKFNFTPEWYSSASEIESDDVTVGAGIFAMHPEFDESVMKQEVSVEETRIAFGQFVTLARRKKKVTIEDLAKDSDLDLGELIAIEQHDAHFIPEPRTVYQLAHFFNVSYEKLMEIAGLTKIRHLGLTTQAMKFAARSASVAELTEQEQRALEEFVVVLSEQTNKN
jgi:transcriptional regulator with XRE-family HTH domain